MQNQQLNNEVNESHAELEARLTEINQLSQNLIDAMNQSSRLQAQNKERQQTLENVQMELIEVRANLEQLQTQRQLTEQNLAQTAEQRQSDAESALLEQKALRQRIAELQVLNEGLEGRLRAALQDSRDSQNLSE